MKKADGYIIKKLENEYVILPYGKRTEEVNEVVTLSETAGFIYENADQAESIEQLAQLVGKEYGVEASAVYEDVAEVVKTLQGKGILL
ncbi:MAG: PqqD family protein [Lachnospiraceae bacterium]|nr:PqqD family protein [Lachnospiraceae bacterium]